MKSIHAILSKKGKGKGIRVSVYIENRTPTEMEKQKAGSHTRRVIVKGGQSSATGEL